MRGDNADRFAEFHELTGRKIASVAKRANAAPAFARQDRANLQALDADLLQIRRDRFVDELVRFHDLLFLFDRIDNRFTAHATDDARREIDDFFVAFVNRSNDDAVHRAAILSLMITSCDASTSLRVR